MPDIDAFIDALWLEEGLSKNTLAAYRRDLELYARWLGEHGRKLIETTETDLTSTPEANELTAVVAKTKKFNAPWARSFSSGV